ncbi:exopolyphosphatase / guanosine-5'-triphosphate,3'-diphosphate pyrophosphatase [Paenibacillus sp. 1_12]|uniref:Ppx/GppA phosphatase family protein n=1 Tax=Paenibacillus sp. 1_12 TaxID=1566278 RepID=UPI0008F17F6F|nr:Ppx/GppA phosphatase family protein [Paenibacillus sp. 1_12]SFM20849.1 exopolyphosphatase / guanosine-5'-triphosphate,3'-diphosphate pyrophosphatase [Paenibacillus sp. 1_12]
MGNNRRIGIIDIGSNSIRLAIYEINDLHAHRVIGEFKQSARLSSRIGSDQILHAPDIRDIVAILIQFKQICMTNQVTEVRAAATAAIRNAANSQEIISQLLQESGTEIELLSGEDEAVIGFLGMSSSLDIEDGILVDIGGGSTEVSIFRNRKLEQSVSFPFGAVNTARKFSTDGSFNDDQLKNIRHMVLGAIAEEPWIEQNPQLPLVGMGGTIRSLSKISQKKRKYTLSRTHNYKMDAAEMEQLVKWLPSMSTDKRKKVDGLSKDRVDIIIPGMLILDTIFQAAKCSHYVISGAGLRDGLFQGKYLPVSQQSAPSILEQSTANLLGLHASAPIEHLKQVAGHAVLLYDALQGIHQYDNRMRICLHTAALLHRIGVSMNYYQFAKHSFYMIAHSPLNGLSHREILICAGIASYKTKGKVHQTYQQYKDVLHETDVDIITKLGTLLQIAIALDASETQAIASISAAVVGQHLHILAETQYNPSVEYREVDNVQKDFHKIWNLKFSFQTVH